MVLSEISEKIRFGFQSANNQSSKKSASHWKNSKNEQSFSSNICKAALHQSLCHWISVCLC
jgi:hypothetical protein